MAAPASSIHMQSSGASDLTVAWNAGSLPLERVATLARRRERFFLRGSPSLVKARLIVARLTVTCCVVAKRVQSSCRVTSGVACAKVLSVSRPLAVSLAGYPPPCGCGATSPVAR